MAGASKNGVIAGKSAVIGRIWGYLRVSTGEQAEDGRSSLGDQEAKIRFAAGAGRDVEIVSDVGVSGAMALSERPGGGPLMRQLAAGDVLIAAKMDRLFRSARDALVTVEDLKARGVRVILADMGFEPVTENGAAKMFFTMLAAFAEFERTRTAERMADGRAGKRSRGGHIGGEAPFGWRVVGSGRTASLEPVESEQVLIDMARGERSRGVSYREISVLLASRGGLNRQGKPFEAMQVKRMMSERAA